MMTMYPENGRSTNNGKQQANKIEGYYRLHAKIYDLTRWTFLFGRSQLIADVAALNPNPKSILEVGCGTGSNLIRLQRTFPAARLTAVDISESMLAVARRKMAKISDNVEFRHVAYSASLKPSEPFDIVLFSYSLSMMNPGWEEAIEASYFDLKTGGYIAAVDFHNSRSGLMQKWLELNHVRLDGHLLEKLNKRFVRESGKFGKAFGAWRYFRFIGIK